MQYILFILVIKLTIMSLKDFVELQKLGEGSFARVYKVRRLSDQQVYAIKKVIFALM